MSRAAETQPSVSALPCLSLGELLSSALSRLQGRAEVSSRQTITHPVLTSREIHEGEQLEQLGGRTRQTRNFSFAFADRSRDKGKYPTIIWQVPQAQCSSLWDVASQKSSPPNAAQKRLAQPHGETQTLLQTLEAETQNARPTKLCCKDKVKVKATQADL